MSTMKLFQTIIVFGEATAQSRAEAELWPVTLSTVENIGAAIIERFSQYLVEGLYLNAFPLISANGIMIPEDGVYLFAVFLF